jgi:hypothetical protein
LTTSRLADCAERPRWQDRHKATNEQQQQQARATKPENACNPLHDSHHT